MQFVAGTAGLWWTYMDKKRFIDDKEDDNIPLLNVDIDSEQAFMIDHKFQRRLAPTTVLQLTAKRARQ